MSSPTVKAKWRKSPPRGSVDELSGLVDDYLYQYNTPIADRYRYVAEAETLSEAIVKATGSGKQGTELATYLRRRQRQLAEVESFPRLVGYIAEANVKGIGSGARWRIAALLGARLGVTPSWIPLTYDAQVGANALGIDVDPNGEVFIDWLPEEFSRLSWWQVDEFLSLYRTVFKPLSTPEQGDEPEWTL